MTTEIILGTFMIASIRYSNMYSDQKLQNIIGSTLYYQKGKDWYFNIQAIVNMTSDNLITLTNKLK